MAHGTILSVTNRIALSRCSPFLRGLGISRGKQHSAREIDTLRHELWGKHTAPFAEPISCRFRDMLGVAQKCVYHGRGNCRRRYKGRGVKSFPRGDQTALQPSQTILCNGTGNDIFFNSLAGRASARCGKKMALEFLSHGRYQRTSCSREVCNFLHGGRCHAWHGRGIEWESR